jgi:DNA-binding response OmpR family regulator
MICSSGSCEDACGLTLTCLHYNAVVSKRGLQMDKKILLVEDSEEFHFLVKSALQEFAQVSSVLNAADALKLISSMQFDLILIDIGLPDKCGFELCSEIRTLDSTRNTPIFFLTGRNDVSDKVAGFSLGADDYIVKPFNILEFRARVMNLFSHEVQLHLEGQKKRVELTPHEYDILKTMIAKPNQVFSRAKLLDSVWGARTFVDDRTVDKHISSLRKKLGSKGTCIQTISSVGYKFETAEESTSLSMHG